MFNYENKIRPKFIAYYKRDEKFKATPINKKNFPKVKFFDTPETLRLEDEDFKDTGAGEDYSESLIDFCKKNPEHLKSVDFVMTRQILTNVAMSDGEKMVQAIRRNGVIYVNWYRSQPVLVFPPKKKFYQGLGEGNAFMKRLTDVESQPFYKLVARATVPLSNGRSAHVLYSGELDGINQKRNKKKRVEVKATSLKLDEWKKVSGPQAFWQSYFGLVEQLILGQKGEGKHYERRYFRKVTIENIIDTHGKSAKSKELRDFMQSQEKLYKEGIGRIEQFLTTLLEMEGDEVVLKRSNGVWEECEKKVDQEFKDLVEDISYFLFLHNYFYFFDE